jgi:hypothetical protein
VVASGRLSSSPTSVADENDGGGSVLELQGPPGKTVYRGKYFRHAAQGLLIDSISKSQLELDSHLDTEKGIKLILLRSELGPT